MPLLTYAFMQVLIPDFARISTILSAVDNAAYCLIAYCQQYLFFLGTFFQLIFIRNVCLICRKICSLFKCEA